MKIKQVKISRFTAFNELAVTFSPGINVVIGRNGTGKSHLLKVMYSMLKAFEVADKSVKRDKDAFPDALLEKMTRVFMPQDDDIGRLSRRKPGANRATVELIGEKLIASCSFWSKETFTADSLSRPPALPTFFLPPREILSVYKGLRQALQDRELEFDDTFLDLCSALDRASLKGKRKSDIAALMEPLEAMLGGKVVFADGRFYVRSEDEGNLEASLVAEGLRKIAMLAHLIANGSLGASTVLFWDEPESSLNPSLAHALCDIMLQLARKGMQIFLATHDFLIPNTLSLAAEYPGNETLPMRFIALHRQEGIDGVIAEASDTMAGLQHDAILDAFSEHYDREQSKVASALKEMDSPEGRGKNR